MAMKDKNDTVMIELDRPRELKLSHKALKRFSALTECSMQEMEGAISRYDKLACLMYVMLAVDAEKHGEVLTSEQADDLLDNVPIYQQIDLAGRAIAAAFNDLQTETAEAAGNPTKAAGTGTEA